MQTDFGNPRSKDVYQITMTDNLPHDAVERVRAIRNRNYEATKHMTHEEKRAHDRKRYEEAKKMMASIDSSKYDFSWLTSTKATNESSLF